MATKTNTKEQQHELLTAFDKYIDTTGAILDDYVADSGMITEMAAADQEFREVLEAIIEDADDFDTLVGKLKKYLKDNSEKVFDEAQSIEIIELLDSDAIIDKVRELDSADGFMSVKIESMVDQDKVENFIRENVHPYNINHGEPIFS